MAEGGGFGGFGVGVGPAAASALNPMLMHQVMSRHIDSILNRIPSQNPMLKQTQQV